MLPLCGLDAENLVGFTGGTGGRRDILTPDNAASNRIADFHTVFIDEVKVSKPPL